MTFDCLLLKVGAIMTFKPSARMVAVLGIYSCNNAGAWPE